MSRHRVFVGLVLSFTVSGWLSGGELKADFINGGFETGDFTGWSTIGNVTIQTAAYGAGRSVASLVYGIRPSDPVVLISATVVVALITCAATALPAKRASGTDPVRALRGD